MSRQLDAYLDLRAGGATMMTAAAGSGIGLAEARLIENDIARGEVMLPAAPIGHNEPPKEDTMADSIAADELRTLIERIERLEEEKAVIGADIKDVYAEAKARGYDTRTMRECVKLRKLERQVREEREVLLDTYKAALGMDFSETPLGSATLQRVEQTVSH